jgi:uncharacterized protein (TIGR03437 family)
MGAQTLKPPLQDSVLEFRTNSVAYTDQISLGPAFTMECWVFLETASPFQVIMGKAANPRTSDPFMNYIIGLDQSGLIPTFVQSTGQPGTYRSIAGRSNLTLNTWNHLAATLDNGMMRLYVNGQLLATGPSPGNLGGAAVPFGLGGAIPDGESICCSISGALRQARVWNRALSASEVQQYAIQELSGNEPGLVADWPLSDGTGTIVRGIGPKSVPLTVRGPAAWAITTILDNGPYWEIRDIPSVSSVEYGSHPAAFLNPQGYLDLLLAYTPYAKDKPTPGPVMFLNNQGQRQFSPKVPLAPSMTFWPRNHTTADFDGDGFQDIVLADHGFDLPPYPGGTTRVFMQRAGDMRDETDLRLPIGVAFTHDVCSADVNLDGRPDLFLAILNSSAPLKGPMLYINDGKGNFTSANDRLPTVFRSATTPNFTACLFADVNLDGAPDLVLGAAGFDPKLQDTLLLNDGHGNFQDATAQSIPGKRGGNTWQTLGIVAGDFNRDGWPDLVITLNNQSRQTTMQLLINNRDGTFHEQPDAVLNIVRGGYYDKAYAVDLNEDGWSDLVVNGDGIGVTVYQNMGGHFEDRTQTLPNAALSAVVGDFDRDGRVDIALITGTTNKIAWGRNLWPAVPSNTPIVSSATMAGGNPAIAQNGWVEIKGTNLAPSTVAREGVTWEHAPEFTAGQMPATLGGVSVAVNGKAAYIYYVSSSQLNVLLPLDDTLGPVDIVVTVAGSASPIFSATLMPAAPSFPLLSGYRYLVATHSDYTLVGPRALSSPGYPVTPARSGETVILYGFGFGLPASSLVNGSISQSGSLPVTPTIQIGGVLATVAFAGLISPGLYQINIVVPNGIQDGDNIVTCTYGGSVTPSGIMIAVDH